MKKYYIADFLTILELILTVVIFYLGLRPDISTGVASFVILAAELCDAFDGIAARTWRYPDEPGKYPWRKYATIYDILSDILLIGVTLWYIVTVALPQSDLWAMFLFWNLVLIGVLAAASVEFITIEMTQRGEKARADKIAVWRRRIIYVPAVVITIVWPLFTSGWGFWCNMAILILYVMIGVAIFRLKQDRWSQRFTK
ncbi:MAG: hypothetical protein Q4F60_01420 [Candidatus Saccharibacteria bacterium]|nr:hypothetical protein [Candidatus Saccharibacteria bacterium]